MARLKKLNITLIAAPTDISFEDIGYDDVARRGAWGQAFEQAGEQAGFSARCKRNYTHSAINHTVAIAWRNDDSVLAICRGGKWEVQDLTEIVESLLNDEDERDAAGAELRTLIAEATTAHDAAIKAADAALEQHDAKVDAEESGL